MFSQEEKLVASVKAASKYMLEADLPGELDRMTTDNIAIAAAIVLRDLLVARPVEYISEQAKKFHYAAITSDSPRKEIEHIVRMVISKGKEEDGLMALKFDVTTPEHRDELAAQIKAAGQQMNNNLTVEGLAAAASCVLDNYSVVWSVEDVFIAARWYQSANVCWDSPFREIEGIVKKFLLDGQAAEAAERAVRSKEETS